jgi:hypothetical protein
MNCYFFVFKESSFFSAVAVAAASVALPSALVFGKTENL